MEYSNASMNIGGKIKRSEVERLVHAIVDDGAGIDWDPLDEEEALAAIEDAARSNTHLTINASDQPWGRFERVEEVCLDLGLTYVAECEAGGDWSPNLAFWQPELGWKKMRVPVYRDGKSTIEEQDVPAAREWAITEIGRGPMIDAEDIQKHLDAGTLADEIALMATVHKFPWKLVIVDRSL
jgi:hypothetical protein